MKVTITERKAVDYETNFTFPICRLKTIDEDERVFWKFESKHKVTRIHEKMSETSILVYDDKNADFLMDFITSEAMLFGHGEYDIISEMTYDKACQRLIDLIYKS